MTERQYGDPSTGVGEATLDLSRRSIPAPEHPAIAEIRIRTRSRHLIIGGAVTTVLILATAIVWHIGFGTFLPAVYLVPLYAGSCGAILLGCLEHITRHSRAQQTRALEIALQTQADQQLLVGLLDEELQQRYYRGCADTIGDQMGLMRTGTDPAVGRATPTPGRTGDVVELRASTARRRNDAPL